VETLEMAVLVQLLRFLVHLLLTLAAAGAVAILDKEQAAQAAG
jgi:CHASE1-domain containing sensor protein